MTEGRVDWRHIAERGSASGIWFLVVLSTVLGRGPARAFLRLLVPYYMAFHGTARRASLDYLSRVHGRATLAMAHDHILRFAQCTLDRLFFVRGKVDLFDVHSHGEEHLRNLFETRRGALLLGAHLGSFEAMQRMADARDMPINIVGYFKNAKIFTDVLERLNPKSKARLVELDTESIDFILKIRECIERGELVALLADRTIPGGREVRVDFLGSPASFPTGPYILASALGCPTYLTFGLHTGSARYDLYCEPFADRIVLPRRRRAAELQAVAQRFAQRLEHYCRLAPDNWFNFYDYWADGEQAEHRAQSPRQRRAIEGNRA